MDDVIDVVRCNEMFSTNVTMPEANIFVQVRREKRRHHMSSRQIDRRGRSRSFLLILK